jgi:hypothetical protein
MRLHTNNTQYQSIRKRRNNMDRFHTHKLPKNVGLYQYNVTFEPDIQSNKLKKRFASRPRCFVGVTILIRKNNNTYNT